MGQRWTEHCCSLRLHSAGVQVSMQLVHVSLRAPVFMLHRAAADTFAAFTKDTKCSRQSHYLEHRRKCKPCRRCQIAVCACAFLEVPWPVPALYNPPKGALSCYCIRVGQFLHTYRILHAPAHGDNARRFPNLAAALLSSLLLSVHAGVQLTAWTKCSASHATRS